MPREPKKPVGKGGKARKGFGRFFKEISSEMKKVSWPNRKEMVNYTIAVVVFILIFAALIGIVDLGLSQLLGLIT